MLLPLLKNFILKFLKIEDESKKNTDLNGILAKYDFFKLVERKLIHPETN